MNSTENKTDLPNAHADKRKLVRNERIRLTANLMNISAAGSFVTGCIAQLAPILYGASPPHTPYWQLDVLAAILFACLLHLVARWIIGDLKP